MSDRNSNRREDAMLYRSVIGLVGAVALALSTGNNVQASEDMDSPNWMANIGALSICSLLLSALAFPNATAAEYTLIPSPQTVHVGHFSAALKPVLTINSGDIVIIETVSGPDPEEVDASGVVPPGAVPEYVRTIRREVTDRGPGGHILTDAG
jgi:hypothetical protein